MIGSTFATCMECDPVPCCGRGSGRAADEERLPGTGFFERQGPHFCPTKSAERDKSVHVSVGCTPDKHQASHIMRRLPSFRAFAYVLLITAFIRVIEAKQRQCPEDPFADPKVDPCNPLHYIPSNTLSAIASGEYSENF